jgi:hypothetical protein
MNFMGNEPLKRQNDANGTQVVDDRLKHSGFEPALRLLIDRRPRGGS